MIALDYRNTILIIDNTQQIHCKLRNLLAEQGYRVRSASDSVTALKAVHKERPDLILIDTLLPERDGYEVCRKLKTDEQFSQIPIIFISAPANVGAALTAFQAGAVDYITTPFRTEEVLARVRTHLKLQHALREKEASHAMLRAILDSIDNAIITVDEQLQVINTNKPLHVICGDPPDDSESFQDRLDSGIGPCAEVIRRALGSRQKIKEYRVECRCRKRDCRTIVLNATPLALDHNTIRGVVLVIRDISRLAELERNFLNQNSYHKLIGKNEEMQKIYALLDQTANLDLTVLICGDSGTGKELIADAIHHRSHRADKPLVKVNCTALSENLLESELFGHVSGAFTGAVKDRVGRCQAAEGGTLFLDEIGDISPQFQAKLLRFLEQKEFERVGDSKTLKADVRVVAATNRNLQEKVHSREFREDLYYRLKGILINLPPLKDRSDDIPLLTGHFLDMFRKAMHKNILGASREVSRMLMTYPWPGNVRELKNTIEYACALCTGEVIEKEHLPPEFLAKGFPEHAGDTKLTTATGGQRGPSSEKAAILTALEQTDWNKSKTARILNISRSTLYSRLLKYQIFGRRNTHHK